MMNNKDETIVMADSDALTFSGPTPLGLTKTIRLIEFEERLRAKIIQLEGNTVLIDPGVDCELLQPGSQGWQKGKLKICIEFIAEKLTHSSELDDFREEDWPPRESVT